MAAPQQHLLQLARRASTVGITTLTGYTTYVANMDPLHIFFDLDHTLLCSVTPLPNNNAASSSPSLLLTPPTIDYFDQIDDDFPFNSHTQSPNTRTYFRPGAKFALWVCSKLGVCHVYTAAQESYTSNIMRELDPKHEIFKGYVLHRTDYPKIVKEGKDLTVVMTTGSNAANYNATTSSTTDDTSTKDDDTNNKNEDIRLERAILFDDKVSNFKPQQYENGVGVVPFTAQRLNKCIGCSSTSSSNGHHGGGCRSKENYSVVIDNWAAYLEEVKEMARLVGISIWGTIHWSGDARKVVGWVRKLDGSETR